MKEMFNALAMATDDEVILEAGCRLQELHGDLHGNLFTYGRLSMDFIGGKLLGVQTEEGKTVYANANFNNKALSPSIVA